MIERLLAGEAALARGELDAAERLFTQVAEADPRNAIAIVGRARVAFARGSTDDARTFAGDALAIDPDEVAAHWLLRELDRSAPAAPQAASESRRRTGWRGWLDRLLRRA